MIQMSPKNMTVNIFLSPIPGTPITKRVSAIKKDEQSSFLANELRRITKSIESLPHVVHSGAG